MRSRRGAGLPVAVGCAALLAGALAAGRALAVARVAARADELREQGRLAERERVARDVHDTVSQSLAGIMMLARAAESALDRPEPGIEQARERVAAAYDTALMAFGQAHDLVLGVAASQLPDSGLAGALERFLALARRNLAAVRQLAELGPVVNSRARETPPIPELELLVTGRPRRLPLAVESAALRTVQEAVGNAVRHAHARRVLVELHHRPDGVRVSVRDDGAGLPAAAAAEGGLGLGMAGFEERVAGLGGRLTVASEPGGGTTVTVDFPHPTRGQRRIGDGYLQELSEHIYLLAYWAVRAADPPVRK